jgi:hypothetical protein
MPVLNEWFALGSGCRAKSDQPGDVQHRALPPDPARPNVHRVRFTLPSYVLDSDATVEGGTLKFGRECAIRVNVNPPEGMRIKDAAATTRVRASKGAGTELVLMSELKIGPSTLGARTATFGKGNAVSDAEEIFSFRSGQKPEEAMPTLKCAEPKILAFNYTWIADRTERADSARVHVGSDRSLDLEVELERCTP